MKKLVAVLLTLAMILGCMPSFAYNFGGELEVAEYGYMSADGKKLNTLYGEQAIRGYAKIINNPLTDDTVSMTLAYYDANDRLVEIQNKTISLNSDTPEATVITPALDVNGGDGSYFKLFLVENNVNITPISIAYPSYNGLINCSNDANAFNKEIELAQSFGIMAIEDDGEFHADKPVTREELAIAIAKLAGIIDIASIGELGTYNDVSMEHKAYHIINRVVKNGYMSASNGFFYPQACATVTDAYNAINAIYKEYGVNKNNNKIVNGIGLLGPDKISKGTLAKMLINAFELSFTTVDGITTSLMTENFDIVKLKATVNQSSVTATTGSNVDEYVKVAILDTYESKYTDSEFTIYDYEDRVYIYNNNYKILVGSTMLSEMVGSKVIIYAYFDTTNTPTALYVEQDTTNTYALTISGAARENVTYNDGIITFEYWANESDRIATIITINPINVYVNGGNLYDSDNYYDVVYALMDFYGTVTFQRLNPATPEDYDTIFIDTYTTMVVDSIDTNSYRITSKNEHRAISFDPDDNSISAKLVNQAGQPMEWTDLKENDIISIKTYENWNKTIISAQLLMSTVSGRVSGITNEGTYDVTYNINGKDYGIDPNGIDYDEIMLGDEGIFYLDIMGNITYFGPDTVQRTYAFVADIGDNGSALAPRTALTLYTSNGSYSTLSTASKVKVDGVSGFETKDITSDMKKTVYHAEYDSLVRKEGATWYDYDATANVLTIDAIEPGQVISYTINTDGYITSIDRPSTRDSFGAGVSYEDKFTQYSSEDTMRYNSSGNAFITNSGYIFPNNDTIIMIAPWKNYDGSVAIDPSTMTADDFSLFNINSINNGQIFENASAYDVDYDKNVDFILVESDVEVGPPDTETEEPVADMGIIKSIGSWEDENFNPVYNVKMLRNGEEQILMTADDTVDVCQYDTIIPKFDEQGNIKDVNVLASVDGDNIIFNEYIDEISADNTTYYYGEITEMSKRFMTLNGSEDIFIPTDANVYIYNNGLKSSNRVYMSDITEIEYDSYDNSLWWEKDLCNAYAIAREHNGQIIDVVIYIFLY